MFTLANEALWFEILLKMKELVIEQYYSYFMMNFSYFNLIFL